MVPPAAGSIVHVPTAEPVHAITVPPASRALAPVLLTALVTGAAALAAHFASGWSVVLIMTAVIAVVLLAAAAARAALGARDRDTAASTVIFDGPSSAPIDTGVRRSSLHNEAARDAVAVAWADVEPRWSGRSTAT